MKKVPLLVTLDVHPVEGMDEFILATLRRFETLGIRATFFVPATVLEDNRRVVPAVLDGGHQIASHGLYHNDKPFGEYPAERYDLLDEAWQRRFITEATERLHAVLGHAPTAFRSPCFGTSGTTLRLLEEHGYRADFSVNSQRLDLLTADPFGFRNLLAPRLPYHPSFENPFRAGTSQIWEIPLSAFIVPFAVMTLITFRTPLTRMFFAALHREARRTGKPIVYMVHPEEFCPDAPTYTLPLKSMRFRDFLPRKGHGIRVRQALRMSDPAQIHRCNENLVEYMGSFDDIEFVTADEYVGSWLEQPEEEVAAAEPAA